MNVTRLEQELKKRLDEQMVTLADFEFKSVTGLTGWLESPKYNSCDEVTLRRDHDAITALLTTALTSPDLTQIESVRVFYDGREGILNLTTTNKLK